MNQASAQSEPTMKKTLLLCSALLALAAPSAIAGIDLTWRACNTTPGMTSYDVLDCAAAGGGAIDLFGCFQVAETQDSVVDMDCSLNVEWNDDPARPLGDFWHFERGGCNDLANGSAVLSITRPDTLCSGTVSPWNARTTQFAKDYRPDTPCSGQFYLTIYRQTPFKLLANTNYFGFRVTFRTDHAVENGTGECIGCPDPIRLFWNTALLINIRADGHPYVVSGAGFVSNCVTLNPGGFCGCHTDCFLNCSTVPVRNRTWGQLKSLYR